jgi:hypothetical protein
MIWQLFRSNFQKSFRVRSPRRDLSADEAAVKSIAVAINLALEKAEAERAGLTRRMGEVTARAAIVAGNDLDDYLTRPEDISKMLNNSDTEIHRGEERLSILEQRIAHFKFLKTALHSRFRDSKC